MASNSDDATALGCLVLTVIGLVVAMSITALVVAIVK